MSPRLRRGAVGVPEIGEQSLRTVIRENVDGMLVIDLEGVVLFANPAAEQLLARDARALAGTRFGYPLVLGKASEIDVLAGGAPRRAEMRVVEVEWERRPAFLASLRDVTDRKSAELLLARVVTQQAALASLGRAALSGIAPEALMAEAAAQVRRVLSVDFSGVLELVPERSELRLVASDRLPATTGPPARPTAGQRSQPAYTLRVDEPVVIEDARREPRFEAWPPDLGVASAATAVIKDGERHLGVVEAASRSPRRWGGDEINFLQEVANLLGCAISHSPR